MEDFRALAAQTELQAPLMRRLQTPSRFSPTQRPSQRRPLLQPPLTEAQPLPTWSPPLESDALIVSRLPSASRRSSLYRTRRRTTRTGNAVARTTRLLSGRETYAGKKRTRSLSVPLSSNRRISNSRLRSLFSRQNCPSFTTCSTIDRP